MLRLLTLCTISLGLTGVSFSDVQSKPAPRAAHSRARPDPIAVALIATAQNSADPRSNLKKACERTDFTVLAWGLEGIRSRINNPKGEFETNAEYAERTHKIESALNPIDPIIICQPLEDNEDAPFEYEADRETFKGSFRSHQNVWRDVKRLKSYVSRTRMGVSAKVTAAAELDYDVEMGDRLRAVAQNCAKNDYVSYSYEVAVPRSDAPGVKAQGYLVFIGKLVAPFIESADTPGSPTLDNPHDVYERDLIVHFAPSEIALVGPQGDRLWGCSLATPRQLSSPAKAPAGASARVGGQIWLQLASGPSLGGLSDQYARIRARNNQLFEGVQAYITQGTDRARLVIGPFRSQSDAQTFAEDLQSLGVDAFTWTNSNSDQFVPLSTE